ncbi:MAG: alpha/beta fold hydrolase [Bacillota bacterium]
MRVKERFVLNHLSGRKITYKEIGDPSGTPVLFFHGWGSVASSIFFEEEFLKENRLYILMVNRPGYGGSDTLQDYSMTDHSDDVKVVLDHLGINQVHCMGWSNGGLFSQVFSCQNPGRIASLSLAGSAIPLESKESRKYLPARWKLIRGTLKVFPPFNRRYLRYLNQVWTGRIGRVLLRLLSRQREERDLENLKGQLKKQTAEGLWEAYQTKGWAEYAELRAMSVPFSLLDWKPPFPVYIWVAEKDGMWPKKTALYLTEKFQGSQLQEVEGKGHFFFLICWKQIIKKALSNE